MKLLQAIIVTLMTICEIGLAQPTVDSVIYVGPAYRIPMSSFGTWSPDDSHILYVQNDTVKIADVSGNSEDLFGFGGRVFRFGWINDTSIWAHVVNGWSTHDHANYLVTTSTISSRADTLCRFHQRSHRTLPQPGDRPFEWPTYNAVGVAYYRYKGQTAAEVVPFDSPDNIDESSRYHILSTDSCFYKVSFDGVDSNCFAPNPWGSALSGLQPLFTPNLRYFTHGHAIFDVSDSSAAGFPTHDMERRPDTAHCGFGQCKLRQDGQEAIFEWECSGHYETLTIREGVIDIASGGATYFDELIPSEHCTQANYSRDGSRIAVICDKVLYIIERKR